MIKKKKKKEQFFFISSFILFFLLHLRGSGVSVVNDQVVVLVLFQSEEM